MRLSPSTSGGISTPKRSVTSTSKGPSGVSNAAIDLLRNKGWGTPERQAETLRRPDADFKLAQTRYLSPYGYRVSDQEYQRMTDEYSGMQGFSAPEPVMKRNAGNTEPIPQAIVDENKRREQFAARQPFMDPGIYQSAELTWEEYEKLSDEQRARVDFNTAMVNAREKDLRTVVKPSDEQRKVYDEQVEKMFGKEGGSDVYAPEVVALLKQIDFQAVGQDLDEYLSLERLTDIEDLKGATFSAAALKQTSDKGTTYKDVRSDANLAVLDARTAEKAKGSFDALMQDGYQILQDWHGTAAVARGGDVEAFGGVAMTAPPGTVSVAGFPAAVQPGAALDMNNIEVQRGLFHAAAFDLLLNKDTNFNDLVKMAEESEFTKADWDKLFNYVDIRTRQQERWGIPTPNNAGGNTREADEIRALVGLEE